MTLLVCFSLLLCACTDKSLLTNQCTAACLAALLCWLPQQRAAKKWGGADLLFTLFPTLDSGNTNNCYGKLDNIQPITVWILAADMNKHITTPFHYLKVKLKSCGCAKTVHSQGLWNVLNNKLVISCINFCSFFFGMLSFTRKPNINF